MAKNLRRTHGCHTPFCLINLYIIIFNITLYLKNWKLLNIILKNAKNYLHIVCPFPGFFSAESQRHDRGAESLGQKPHWRPWPVRPQDGGPWDAGPRLPVKCDLKCWCVTVVPTFKLSAASAQNQA